MTDVIVAECTGCVWREVFPVAMIDDAGDPVGSACAQHVLDAHKGADPGFMLHRIVTNEDEVLATDKEARELDRIWRLSAYDPYNDPELGKIK